ncbi:hypothetical protein PY365_04295 [Roseiarcaceae bacterium H3SJ34-1]|uniref:hypothetical protein n=1 Tax=Terripilifer ovatus TaxID=3032367 RepID=UPI003AB98F81|nr:hypothetical protein [Roseiarcaceae bacterium H3SJ34-1]
MHSRRHRHSAGVLAGHEERLFGNSNWDKRRPVIYLSLLFCAGNVQYLIVWGADTALHQQIALALIAFAVSVVGSYCFAAVWDDKSKRDAAVAAAEVPDDDDEVSERPDPPTSLPTDRR